MGRTHEISKRAWLPSLLLVMSMSVTGWTQETSAQSQQNLTVRVMSALEDYEQGNNKTESKAAEQKLRRLQSTIENYTRLADEELKNLDNLLAITAIQMKEPNEKLKVLNAQALKEHGALVQSEETIDFLIRNCLIEQQRLALDLTTERRLLEIHKQTNDEFEAEKLRISAEEIVIRGMMEELMSLKKLSEAKQVDDRKLAMLENDIAVKQTKLQAMLADMKQKKATVAASTEGRVADIKLRLEMLQNQLERLGNIQQGAATAKQLRASIEAESKRMQKAEDRAFECAMKKAELDSLNRLIISVLPAK